jgi:hypothetical protein
MNSNIPSLNQDSIKSFKERFLLNIPEDQVKENLIKKMNVNYNTWGGWAIDIYHGSPFLHKIYEFSLNFL